MTAESDVFGTNFFAVPFPWEAQVAVGIPTPRGKSLRRFALIAGLAAATVGLTGEGNDYVGPRVSSAAGSSNFAGSLVSPGKVLGRDILASPDDYLASIEAGHKARNRAYRILEAGGKIGPPADRVVKIARGGVAVYWLSKQHLEGGAAARFALFECEKDGAHLILSNHDPKAIEVFEVKVSNLEQLVQRAIAYTA